MEDMYVLDDLVPRFYFRKQLSYLHCHLNFFSEQAEASCCVLELLIALLCDYCFLCKDDCLILIIQHCTC